MADVPQKTRVLVLSSRNVTTRHRHLLSDLRDLLPHSKKESKMDNKDHVSAVNELCDLRSCNSCIFMEVHRKKDVFLWFARSPTGPSVKFHVLNIHTMLEMRMAGNCLKGSRPILSFDHAFDSSPHWGVIKELFTQIFSTPKGHPHSKPFIDHVMSFSIIDDKIWFRNYQIIWSGDAKAKTELVEIGPRFVLNPIRVFHGSFQGTSLYVNPAYIAPSQMRRAHKARLSVKYQDRIQAKAATRKRRAENVLPEDELEDVFARRK